MSDEYEVIDNVGNAINHNTRLPKYPLNKLQINQCIFIPNGNIRRLSSMVIYAMRNRMGCTMKKFICRTIINSKGIKGVAIIRIPHPIYDTAEWQASSKAARSSFAAIKNE